MTGASEGATLAGALVRLAHLVQRIFSEVSRNHDLTPQQAQLLCLLIDGPVGMGELSRTLNLEKSSLTGLVDRIERRGLAARTRDSCDRRACQIALTDEGIRLANKSHRDVIARVEALAAELSSADREMLISSTAKFDGLAART
ncbi:MAG TPA: MarR family transcriptional regulator [Mycobacteriales bacterium]|nr:MarR family transcriptional regulator [Mycobacteriales bacterium]